MKKIYSVAAKFVRWMIAGILSFIAALPAFVSLSIYAQAPIDRSIEVPCGLSSPSQPKCLSPVIT